MQPIQAFRTIVVPVETGKRVIDVVVPFDMELLERFEETLQRCEEAEWKWLRTAKGQKTILQAYEDFCRPYLNELDLKKLPPDFCALFFSRVKEQLLDSIGRSLGSTPSTDASAKPTATKTTEVVPPSA